MKTYRRVVTTILVSLLAFSVLVVLASFAGFMGAGLMDLTAVVALLCWGTFLVLTLFALGRVRAINQGERRQLGPSYAWTSGLSFAAFWLSLGTAFLLGLGAFATCGPIWLSSFYYWGGLFGSMFRLTAWFVLPHLTHAMLEALPHRLQAHRCCPRAVGSARAAAWRTVGSVPQRQLGRSACGGQRRRQFGQVQVAQDGALGKPGQHAPPACALLLRRRSSSIPVKRRCVVPSGMGRFSQARRGRSSPSALS